MNHVTDCQYAAQCRSRGIGEWLKRLFCCHGRSCPPSSDSVLLTLSHFQNEPGITAYLMSGRIETCAPLSITGKYKCDYKKKAQLKYWCAWRDVLWRLVHSQTGVKFTILIYHTIHSCSKTLCKALTPWQHISFCYLLLWDSIRIMHLYRKTPSIWILDQKVITFQKFRNYTDFYPHLWYFHGTIQLVQQLSTKTNPF